MAGKKSKKKQDPSDISKEELTEFMAEAGISADDRRYISNPNDPRAKKLSETEIYKEVIKKFGKRAERIKAGKSPEHQTSEIIEKRKGNIRKELDRILIETGSAKVIPKEERDAQAISMKEYLKRDKTITIIDEPKPKKQRKKVRRKTKPVTGAIPEIGEAELLNRLSAAEKELAEKEKELEEIKKVDENLVAKIQNTFGENKKHLFPNLNISFKQLFKIINSAGVKKERFKKIAEELTQIRNRVKKYVEEGIANLFIGLDRYYPNQVEADGFFNFSGASSLRNVLASAGEEKVQIKSSPEAPLKIELYDNEILMDALFKVLKAYDFLLEQTCGNLTLTRGSLEGSTNKLKELGMSEEAIEKIVAGTQSKGVGTPAEIQRKLDEHPKLKRDIKSLEEQLEALKEKKGKKQDNIAILKQLLGIGKALEAAGQYITYEQDPNVSSSQAIDLSVDLAKVKEAITEIVIELAGRQEESVELRQKIAKLKKQISGERKPSLIMDPILRKLYRKFSTVEHVLDFYAKESGFTLEPLEKINYQAEDAAIQVIKNYFRLLDDLKEVIQIDISGIEKKAQREFEYVIDRVPAKLRKKKDILSIRKNIEEVIRVEEKKIKRAVVANIKAVPEIIKNSKISEKTLLERTGYEKVDANCLASYVNPLYEKIIELDSVFENQKELAETYDYESFSDLKQEAEELNEKVKNKKTVFKKSQELARNAGEKAIRTRPDATKFVKKLYSQVQSLDKDQEQIQREQQEILNECIIPSVESYEGFKKWLSGAYKKLEAIGDPTKDRQKICRLVQKIDPEHGATYQESMQYLRDFVSNPLFEEASVNLSYFSELSEVFSKEFNSGHELIHAIDEEKKQFKRYLKIEESRLKKARAILPPNGNNKNG